MPNKTINLLKVAWNKRYEEVKDNPKRLANLMNDFYIAHKTEINEFPWFKNFYEKVVNRYEEVCKSISV